jgi:hypothetical protein
MPLPSEGRSATIREGVDPKLRDRSPIGSWVCVRASTTQPELCSRRRRRESVRRSKSPSPLRRGIDDDLAANSLAQEVRLGLGNKSSFARRQELLHEAGFTHGHLVTTHGRHLGDRGTNLRQGSSRPQPGRELPTARDLSYPLVRAG